MKKLIDLIYQAAHIQRWNDHIRPGKGFTELDKQAHKMIIAFVLAKHEESCGKDPGFDWRLMIEGGIFEFLQRVVLTDIKPTIFHELVKQNRHRLNSWVLDQLRETAAEVEEGFYENFRWYLDDPGYSPKEKKILEAAHFLATNWEFNKINSLNSGMYGLDDTRRRIENEIEEHYDLVGVQKLGLGKKTYHFVDFIGSLRFQQRWAHSPRIPETSVMGHMLIVAILAYLCTVKLRPCPRRLYNNFFGGLFHDLPEVLTRDIISPVKRAVEGLEELIKAIEKRQMEERLLPLLPVSWHDEFLFFIENEFQNRVTVKGEVRTAVTREINEKYNLDQYNPIDGEIIKACDSLSAYVEASLSISHGVKSRHLLEGRKNLYNSYRNREVAGIDFGGIFESYEQG